MCFLKAFVIRASSRLKMTSLNSGIWTSCKLLRKTSGKLLEPLVFNSSMRMRRLILKNMIKRNLKNLDKLRRNKRNLMMMEMRLQRMELKTEEAKVAKENKHLSIELKTMNGTLQTESLKTCLSFLWRWKQMQLMKWNQQSSLVPVNMKLFRSLLMNSARELVRNQASQFTNKWFSRNDY